MKRPIKFRGRRNDNGELVYGSYLRQTYNEFGTIHTIIDECGEEFTVEGDSIAQLVAYDCYGNEVYENDELVNDNGDEFTAVLCNGVITEEGFVHQLPLDKFKLKEATK